MNDFSRVEFATHASSNQRSSYATRTRDNTAESDQHSDNQNYCSAITGTRTFVRTLKELGRRTARLNSKGSCHCCLRCIRLLVLDIANEFTVVKQGVGFHVDSQNPAAESERLL
jgi:hypothetical protein